MDRDEYLDAIRRDSAALVDAARRAGLDAAVPSCPAWKVRDLVWHQGEVHHFWATIVAERMQSWEGYEEPERPGDDALLDWYATREAFVLDVLGSTNPTIEIWTWAGPQAVSWVVRRMAQETAVHRVDAELAAGRSPDVEATLAVDGIDEFFAWFTGPADDGVAPLAGTVHLHATDAEGEFLVEESEPGGRLVARREHAKGDAAIRGRASDLLLLLWHRLPFDDRFEVFGDRALAERLVAHTTIE